MDIVWIITIATILISFFVISQAFVIFWLMKENERLGLIAEENSPPF